MHLHLDPDFDSGTWSGAFNPGEARAGEAWIGEAGFVGIVETALGLTAPPLPTSTRVARLARALLATEGFWSASAEVDPLGSARTLLAWSDALRLHGWRGEAVAPRLAALAAVTAGLPPGLPERLAAASEAAAKRRAEIETVSLHTPRRCFPKLLRALLDALARGGTRVEEAAPVIATRSTATDLVRAAFGPFSPAGDGSLQLVRPRGVLAAADAVAAALAELPSLESTVVVGGDAVLDGALRRYGLPTLGGPGGARDNALLEILPLAMQLASSPPDPQRALELLTLPFSPIPRRVATRLVRALHECPAVGSDRWREALAAGLEQLEGEARPAAAARIEALFGSPATTPNLPIGVVRAKLGAVSEWLRARTATLEEGGGPVAPWYAALSQCEAFAALVELSGREAFAAPLLGRYVDEATRCAPAVSPYPAEVGLAAVGAPGGVVAACERVVWWSFHLGAAPRARPWPFTRDELAALAGAGAELPDPATTAVENARRWRRPLDHATRHLVLVCPETGEGGDERHPHPLWDALVASLPAGQERLSAIAKLTRSTAAFDRAPGEVGRELRPGVVPTGRWKLPEGLVEHREVESPSSAADLLACPLKWVLRYAGRVSGGATAALKEAENLLGELTHALIARVLQELPSAAPEQASARAAALFDSEGPRFAASLFLPGADAPRSDARLALTSAVAELYRILRDGELEVLSVEQPYRMEALGATLEGRPDLVLRDAEARPAIVDLKWSGFAYRRDSLESGAAHQLASYSALVASGAEPFPPVAYFILQRQRLLTTDPEVFPRSLAVAGPAPKAIWKALCAAHGASWREVAGGTVRAPALDDGGALVPKGEDGLDGGGELHLSPSCGFCDYHTLCGVDFASAPEGGEEVEA